VARVLLIASYAPSLIGFRGKLLESLVSRGHEVFSCATDIGEDTLIALQSLGVTYYDIPLARRGLNPLKDLLYLWRLYLLIRRLKIEVILGYTIKPVIYGSVAARLAGVECVSSMISGLGYSFFADSLSAKVLRAVAVGLFRISLCFNQVVFFQNRDDIALFRQLGLVGGKNIPVRIPGSGVDINHFEPAPLPPVMTFLMIARLTKEKGVMDYLEAAVQLKREFPHVRFLLVGGSFSGSSYLSERELAEYTEKGAVTYMGTRKDVRPVIADCTVYVLPTHGGEGIPRTILEAMAMGRPVITTDTPGCREAVIDGKNGRLVPPRDVPILAASMRRFIEGKEDIKRMAAHGRAMVEQQYDVRLVNKIIIENLQL